MSGRARNFPTRRCTVFAVLLGALRAVSAGAQDADTVESGKALYEYWCATCHGPGIGTFGAQYLPGTDALRVKYQGALPALLADRTDMSRDFVKYYVRQGITVMPFFRKTEIDDAELDAIAAYLTRTNR